MIAAFGRKSDDNLGRMQYTAYSKMVASAGGSFIAGRLPATTDAAELHGMRVHFQSVFWSTLGHTLLQQTDWGLALRWLSFSANYNEEATWSTRTYEDNLLIEKVTGHATLICVHARKTIYTVSRLAATAMESTTGMQTS